MKNYLFKSERLGFRNWIESDKEPYALMNTDKDVMKFFPNIKTKTASFNQVIRFQKHYKDNGFTFFAVDILKTSEFIGIINTNFKAYFTPCVEIGWRLQKKYWGFGYATEGAKRCIKYGFKELEFKEIVAITPLKNLKSENVMQKIGMTKQGTFEHPQIVDGHWLKTELLYKIENI